MEKRNIVLAGVLAGIISTLSVNVSSEEAKKDVGSGANPFSDCGIGAALFPDTNWAAVISNVIWDAGTTAVTSATASPETCNGKEAKTAQFIIDNYDNVVEETARGQGEHLTAMLNTFGCAADTHGAVISSVRAQIADKVNSGNYADSHLVVKASDYYSALNSSAQSCSA